MADLTGKDMSIDADEFCRAENGPRNNEYTDVVYEHDPDLTVEVDIQLVDREEAPLKNGHSSPRGPNVSCGQSDKNSSKSKPEKNLHSSMKTRARPIKSHEVCCWINR